MLRHRGSDPHIWKLDANFTLTWGRKAAAKETSNLRRGWTTMRPVVHRTRVQEFSGQRWNSTILIYATEPGQRRI
jgi:hypothetical protein